MKKCFWRGPSRCLCRANRRSGTVSYTHLVANAAGILYNKDLFEENGWKVPSTWQEFTTLCDEIKQSGTLPLYLGFKDTWTCLAPWLSLIHIRCV